MVVVVSQFNGTSTPKGSYSATTGDSDCNINSSCNSLKNYTVWEHLLSTQVWTKCPTRPDIQGVLQGGCSHAPPDFSWRLDVFNHHYSMNFKLEYFDRYEVSDFTLPIWTDCSWDIFGRDFDTQEESEQSPWIEESDFKSKLRLDYFWRPQSICGQTINKVFMWNNSTHSLIIITYQHMWCARWYATLGGDIDWLCVIITFFLF